MLFGKHINRYYLKYLPSILLGIFALVMVDYAQLLVPEFYRTVINGMNDGVITTGQTTVPFDMTYLLDNICLPMIFVILALVAGRFLWRICFFGSAIKVETDLRGRMFDHCKDLSQEYYQSNKVGNMMSLFTNDLETVQDCFGSGILSFCDALLLGSLAMVKMANMNLLLTGLALIPMALMVTVGLVVGKYMTLKWAARQEAFSSLSDFAQESFAGIAVIKAFVKETKELWAFQKLNVVNEDTNVAYTKLSTKLHISITLLIESVICIILGYGGYLVYTDVFNPGQLVEFIGYFNAVIWPVMAISQLIEMRSRGKASLDRISELLDTAPVVVDKAGATDDRPITGDIECRGLTFQYPVTNQEDKEERRGGYDVLKNVTFHIGAGENVGIIGKTGAGKTTLVDLILRTYNVPDGTIFLDGRDVNTIPIRTVRQYAAYVPQDNFLFSDTIAANIAFAAEGDDRDDVTRAAALADVDENIRAFAEGYETVLGERGVTVSGGQKQRISIARAIMKNAPILILDDSVSAVDVKTEKAILSNLRQVRQGKTTILIAHRITTVEKMDKILFLEDGCVTAVGTHAELLENCSSYRTMVELQKLDDLANDSQANNSQAKTNRTNGQEGEGEGRDA